MMRGSPGGGWIEVVAGPMFSGKSEELIRLLRRAAIARQRLQVFKPGTDNRYSEEDVVSHSRQRIPCEVVEKSEDILLKVDPRTDVVGIDEVQFFDDGLPKVCSHLANLGKRVIVAGLGHGLPGRAVWDRCRNSWPWRNRSRRSLRFVPGAEPQRLIPSD